MRSAGTDFSMKKQVYEQGENARPLTLQGLSLAAGSRWQNSTMYNLYVHTFAGIGKNQEHDKDGYFDGQPVAQYADRLIQDLFALQIEHLEAEGVVIFIVLMAFWSMLSDVQRACWDVASEKADAAAKQTEMFQFLDQAAALWVGDGQKRGDSSTGFMMYNLAQITGDRFNQQMQGSTEVMINREILQLLIGMQSKIEKNECTDVQGYMKLRQEVQLAISYSNTVLIQMLLHRIMEADNPRRADFVEMYVLSILPSISLCDKHLYDGLITNTVKSSIADSTQSKVIEILQSSYRCLHINCDMVGGYQGDRIQKCDDNRDALAMLADYQPTSDVRKAASLDRDIAMIDALMARGAFSSAYDIYAFGWNSDATLQDLAVNEDSDIVSQYLEYYDQDDDAKFFPDNLIRAALQMSAPFQQASDVERASLVMSTIQSTIVYWGVAEHLYKAALTCESGKREETSLHWDIAAAYFIGSMEGPFEKGQEGGQMTFALTKQLCSTFGNCEPSSSMIGDAIISLFTTGGELIRDNKCPALTSLIKDDIHPRLLVPLIQGTIYYAARTEQLAAAPESAALLSFSRSILPAIYDANSDGAATLALNTDFIFAPLSSIDLEAVFRAFAQALDTMPTACSDIGRLVIGGIQRGFCTNDTTITVPTAPVPTPVNVTTFSPSRAPVQAPANDPVFAPTDPPRKPVEPHPEGIAWGRFTFSNNEIALRDSGVSIDIKLMYMALSPHEAEGVYHNQSAGFPGGLSGAENMKNLKDLSTLASSIMHEDPMYNFYRVALFEDASFDDVEGASGWTFGHEIVTLALAPTNGNNQQLGSKAALVMNVWIFLTNRLYSAVRQCKQQGKPLELIDSAVALWIGQEQAMGEFNSGWMLYSLAQEAAQFYGNPIQESRVNEKLMGIFNDLQEAAGVCQGETEYRRMRAMVDKAVRLLTLPLVQNLLYYISINDFEYVELYSLSVVAHSVSCSEGLYDSLKDALFSDFQRDTRVTDKFKEEFAQMLLCLDIKCEDLGDVSNANSFLKNMVGDLCSRLEKAVSDTQVAGFIITNDVSRLDRIDLDIHQIELFMRAEAYELAWDVYRFGRNAIVDETKWHSLGRLANELSDITPADLLTTYQNYMNDKDFVLSTMMSVLIPGQDDAGRFAGASRRQFSEVAFRTSQSLLSFLLVVGRLRTALQSCSNDMDGRRYVDEAAALFTGSIEGRHSGGDPRKQGRLMYALAKDVCDAFGKCESHGDALSNEVVMFALSELKANLDSGLCDHANAIFTSSIMPMLLLPLVQGTLFFANANVGLGALSTNTSLVAADIVAQSILPLVNEVNPLSAAVILDNTEFSRSQDPVREGVEVLFDAFAKAIGGMGIECENVGRMGLLSTCLQDGSPAPPPSNSSTNLGNDLFLTSSYVQERANIALDIKDIMEQLEVGNKDQAYLIYSEGLHSGVYDSLGRRTGLRSLQSFSQNVSMVNPLYVMSLYALADDKGKYRGKDAAVYMDTIVRDSFSGASVLKAKTLAAEAAVSLNVWMEVTSRLYDTVRRCKQNQVTNEEGVESIDEAVAYWIGDGRIGDNPQRGHLLYALAERMGEYFGSTGSGQARVNGNILRLFHQVKIELSFPAACSDTATRFRVQHIINKIISQMIALNVQVLVHYLRMGDSDRVSIHAHGFVPFVASCSPSTLAYLKEKLLHGSYPEADVDDIIQSIYSTLPCFGLQCNDIGVHESESGMSSCKDPRLRQRLGGYNPSSDVREFALMDVDILELKILMEMGAYEAAEDLYVFGKNVPSPNDGGLTALSLQYLARKMSASKVPLVQNYHRFFNVDGTFADTEISQALTTNPRGLSKVQRSILVSHICRFIVLFSMAVIEIEEASDACTERRSGDTAIMHWEKVAAFVIGYLEGSGSDAVDGILLWSLSKQMCAEFGTCSSEVPGSSIINDRITTLLYAGRGAILSGNCAELRSAGRQMIPVLQAPLVQATLSAAVKLGRQSLSTADKERVQAQAHGYSLAILPAIDAVDRSSAAAIAANLPMDGKALEGGIQVVAVAFAASVRHLAIPCEYLGESEDIDICTGNVKPRNVGLITGLTAGFVGIILVICLIYRQRRGKRKSEEETEFLAPKGELNHTCEISAGRSQGGESDDLILSDADGNMDDEHDENGSKKRANHVESEIV